MTFSLSTVKSIQLEISSYCNAACPQCPRNYFGGSTIPTLPLKKWSLNEFKKIFTIDLLDQLEQVYFCGTYGDPMTNTKIVDMCQFLKESRSDIKIGIHTNGGVGQAHDYTELAKLTDFIAFGIDGLEDTNDIYRRHVKWTRVMDNAQAYISAGGCAIWDFIVFKHNEHQIEQARELSQELGFNDFTVKKTSRFLNRSHDFSEKLLVQNRQGFIDYAISIPTNPDYRNEHYQILHHVADLTQYAKTTPIHCNALRIQEIYIGADGFVFPCGWLHDRLYGPEVENHPDHTLIKQLMAHAGGWNKANVFHTSLKDIVDGSWFETIAKSWTQGQRLERCGIMCGEKINLIQAQNQEVSYKT